MTTQIEVLSSLGAGKVPMSALCVVCGFAFETEGISRGESQYPFHDRCPECRGVVTPETPFDHRAYLRGKRVPWTSVCPKAFQDTERGRLAEPIQKAVVAYEYESKGILFVGGVGTGKTRGMWLLLKKLYGRDFGMKAYSPGEFFKEYQESFGEDRHSQWVENLSRTDVLFFDDIGQEAYTERSGADFFGIFNARIERNLPTFFTTNYRSEELRKMLPANSASQFIRRLVDHTLVVKTGYPKQEYAF